MTVTLPAIEATIKIPEATIEFDSPWEVEEYRHQRAKEALLTTIHDVVDQSIELGETERKVLMSTIADACSGSVNNSLRTDLMELHLTTRLTDEAATV